MFLCTVASEGTLPCSLGADSIPCSFHQTHLCIIYVTSLQFFHCLSDMEPAMLICGCDVDNSGQTWTAAALCAGTAKQRRC